MNKKVNTAVAIAVIIIIAGTLGTLIWLNKNSQDKSVQTQPQQIVKTENKQAENSIVGEWFPLKTTKGGLGTGIAFTADGKASTKFGAFVAFKYKFEGDTLTTTFPDTPDIVQKVEITGSKMTLSSKDGKQELTRIAGDPSSGIVGKWTGDHYTGGKQIIDFTASQNEYLSVPMNYEYGTYQIKGDIIELSGKINTSWRWSIDGDILTLTTSDDERTDKYLKIK